MVMPATKRTDLIAINLRMPKTLHRSLKQHAKRNGVPLNTEMIQRLAASLEGTHDLMAMLKRLDENMRSPAFAAGYAAALGIPPSEKPEPDQE
jgi:ribosomal protein L12E/L44/L45/RPP1/RPP2